MHKKNASFTLIEMLIVIVIIGILASALIPRLISVQGKARDVQRKSDIRQISQGLAMYKNDKGAYPSGMMLTTEFDSTGSYPLAPTYLTTIPKGTIPSTPYMFGLFTFDPILIQNYYLYSTGSDYGYRSFIDGPDGMILMTKTESLDSANWGGGSIVQRIGYDSTIGKAAMTYIVYPTNAGYIDTYDTLASSLCSRAIIDNSITGGNQFYVEGVGLGAGFTPTQNGTCHVGPSGAKYMRYVSIQK